MRNLLIILSVLSMLLLQACVPIIAGGVVAGAMVAEDRRTVGAQADDQGIELKVLNRASELYKDKIHLNVTSYNYQVLLTGEVPTEQERAGIENIARSLEHVTKVTNELVAGPNTTIGSRSNDSLITSKIKTKFVSSGRGAFYPNHVKVVTENNVVYLMGIVTKAEGDTAANIAADTKDVTRVVKVFEYREATPPAGATRTEAGTANAPATPAPTAVQPAVRVPGQTPVPAQVPAYVPPANAPIQPPPQAPTPVPLPTK
jgi:osmotically-inducible protein OsmY